MPTNNQEPSFNELPDDEKWGDYVAPKRVNVAMPKELHQWIAETAKRERRSANGQIVYMLKLAKISLGGDGG